MKGRLLTGCTVFLLLFGVYLGTLNPAFRADDSPETQASCVTLGIQHPPGYPLHTLVGRLFSMLPLGSPAWRLNLMAAFFGALASGTLAAALPLAGTSCAAGASAGLLLGLCSIFWSQSLSAKGGIYTFHTFFLALLLMCLLLWDREVSATRAKPQPSRLRLLRSRYFQLATLVFFLGFGNHWETQVLLVPSVTAWLWLSLRELRLDPKASANPSRFVPLAKAGLLAAAALSVYLYLPLRAAQDPVMNWGDPKTWRQFWWVLLRQEYLDLEVGFLKSLGQALFSNSSWANVAENWMYVQRQGLRVLRFLFSPWAALGWAPALLSLFGTWSMWKEGQRRLPVFLVLLAACFSLVIAFYFHLKAEMVWILDVFLLPAYLAQAALAAWGLDRLARRFRAEAGLWPAAAALGLALFALRRDAVSQREHFWAWDFGKNLLLSCKRNAILFAEGDFNTMPLYYLRHVKGERPDLIHITTIFTATDWGVEQLKRRHPDLGVTAIPRPNPHLRVGDGALLSSVLNEIIRKNHPTRPVQASLFRQVQSENLAWAEPSFSPSGLTVELAAPETPAQARRRENLPQAMVLRDLRQDRSRYEPSPEFALSNYGTMYLDLANFLRSRGRIREAMAHYARAADITSRPNLAEALTHWGIALASQGELEAAVEKFQKALKVKPLFEAYANLAGTYNQLKRYAQAEAFARKAVELNPQNGQSWNNLAISLYYQNRPAEALQAMQKAARLSPSDPAIQANLRALQGSP